MATITGNIEFSSGVDACIGMTFVPQGTPQAGSASVIIGHDKRIVTNSDGDIPAGVELELGVYTVKFDNGEEFDINVPDDDDSYDIIDLIVSSDDDQTPPSIGVVDPEGVVSQPAGKYYFNTANNSFWVKRTGTGNTGWQQLLG